MRKPRLPRRGLTDDNVGELAGMQHQCMAGGSSVERCPPVQETIRRFLPRGPLKMYQLWPLENVPGIGGHFKMYQA
jgi:hypothetical protein